MRKHRPFTARFMAAAVIMASIFAISATTALAHPGHSHDDGRIPGEPDFRRIGTMEFDFHPRIRAYTYKSIPNAKPQWYHFDDFEAASGAFYKLPPEEESVACATSGHRIRVAYASTSNPAAPTTAEREAILSIVRRMNWKIAQEALRSSENKIVKAMRVDCEANGQIRIHTFTSSGSGYPEIVAAAKKALGEFTGAESVKNLIFFDGAHPEGVAGIGGIYKDTIKSSGDSSGNHNRTNTTSAVAYNPPGLAPLGYWDTHVPIHELTHAMGGVQTPAPFATANHHCTDGIDILCYIDAPGVPYSETRCPANGYFDTPNGTPLDCGYDSYFDALEESGEWLKIFWNVGGSENPFLVLPDYLLRDSNSLGPAHYVLNINSKLPSDVPISGDWNGDGFETTGFYRPSTSTWYLRNGSSSFSGPADTVFQSGIPNWRPVAGDWNGDGIDTVGGYLPSTGVFYLSSANAANTTFNIFTYGNSEDLPIAGDWNNNGTDTIGLYRPSTGVFYLSNANASVPPDYSFAYGNPGNDDRPVAGDWDGNGYDSVGVYRQSNGTWYLDNEVPGNQPVSYVFGFGVIGHTLPIVGDWNNSATDTPGVGWK